MIIRYDGYCHRWNEMDSWIMILQMCKIQGLILFYLFSYRIVRNVTLFKREVIRTYTTPTQQRGSRSSVPMWMQNTVTLPLIKPYKILWRSRFKKNKRGEKQKHTTAGIRWSSPTQLLIRPLPAWLWESGRDPVFSGRYGRMYQGYHQLYFI